MARTHSVGEILRQHRLTRDLTQREVARRLTGYAADHPEISRYETGLRHPRVETLVRLSEALDLTAPERDRLLMAAGYPALDPLGLLVGEDAEAAELLRIYRDPTTPAAVRELLRLAVRLAGEGRP